MKSNILAMLLFFLAFAPAAPGEPLAPNEVKTLLDQIRAKRAAAPQVQADFEEEKEVHLMNKPISARAKFGSQPRINSAVKSKATPPA